LIGHDSPLVKKWRVDKSAVFQLCARKVCFCGVSVTTGHLTVPNIHGERSVYLLKQSSSGNAERKLQLTPNTVSVFLAFM